MLYGEVGVSEEGDADDVGEGEEEAADLQGHVHAAGFGGGVGGFAGLSVAATAELLSSVRFQDATTCIGQGGPQR